MADKQFIDFGGLPGIRGMTGTFTRGVAPSTFTLYCRPQSIPDGGTATLLFGQSGNLVEFRDCAITKSYVRQWTGMHPTMAVNVQDRRWRWKFTAVNGHFNTRMPDGLVDQATVKQPGELAAYILQSMGETNFNTSFMPTGVYPPADWVNKRGDLALQELCDYVACEVVLNWATNGIEIWPLGVGNTTEPIQTAKVRHVPRTNVPSEVQVRCGPSRWQTALKLRPVMRNASTPQQRLINNVEFKPEGGWERQSPFSFQSITNQFHRALCFGELWRNYRVVGQADGSIQPPFCNQPISSVDQYILEDNLIESEIDLEGYRRQMPYYIGGEFWAYTDLPVNSQSMYYSGPATLYKDRRLVVFPIPVHGFNSSGQPTEPTLYLFTSYKLEATNGELVHLRSFDSLGGSGGPLILNRPEIFSIYNTASIPGSQTNTEQQALFEASNYVQIFKRKYQNPNASETTFPGFVPGFLDGNICSITWNLSGYTTPWTKACEHEELDAFNPNKRARLDAVK